MQNLSASAVAPVQPDQMKELSKEVNKLKLDMNLFV